jgi:hypothetical protein
MFLQATEALSTVATPELCGVLRLGAHPCKLQDLWPRPPYSGSSGEIPLHDLLDFNGNSFPYYGSEVHVIVSLGRSSS